MLTRSLLNGLLHGPLFTDHWKMFSPMLSPVTALFGEGSDAAAVVALATALDGVPLEQAWERDEVQALLADGALAWYGPAEWQQLLGG